MSSSQSKSRVESKLNTEGTVSIDSYLDKRVYTTQGRYVGTVDEVMISFAGKKIDGLGLRDCNLDLFKNSRTLGKVEFPYDWVRAVDDVVIVRPVQKESLTV